MRNFVLRHLLLLSDLEIAVLVIRYTALGNRFLPSWKQIAPLVNEDWQTVKNVHDMTLLLLARRTEEKYLPHTMWDLQADVEKVKEDARRKSAGAMQSGRLVKQPCQNCGAGAEFSEGHHRNYFKALAVTWLCHPCHLAEHAENHQINGAMLIPTSEILENHERLGL
jgi:hypothetical protein